MILNINDITRILRDNPSRALIAKAAEYNKKMRMHLYGEDLSVHLKTINGFEQDALHKLRVTYARSNKDLFARLSRPLDKIFSAKGGSTYYQLPETKERKAVQLCNDIRHGYSVKKWNELFWLKHYLDDPNGIIMMEMAPQPELQQLRKAGKSFVFPTYQPITNIFDYQPKGAELDYIVFKVSEAEKKAASINPNWQVYRIVDDAMDYWVRWDSGLGVGIVLTEHSYVNYFGRVPAMLCSDIPHSRIEGLMVSFFDEVIELADHFILKGSIKITHDFMHGFPKYWEYADDCHKCGGTGLYDGAECDYCKGTGRSPMVRVSDVKVLTPPTSKDDAVIAPNVGNYIEPSKIFWEIATSDITDLENLMHFTLYGAESRVQSKGMSVGKKGDVKTATEVVDDVKPEADRLYDVSEAAERIDKFIRDLAIQVQVQANYAGAMVNYGRRYMLEGPDTIWEKYCDAKVKKAPISALDDLYVEYIEAKYSTDPVKMAILRKLMRVEPFFHQTAAEVKALMPAEDDYKAKLYFGEWLSTCTDAKLLALNEVELRADLLATISVKQLPAPEPAKPIAA